MKKCPNARIEIESGIKSVRLPIGALYDCVFASRQQKLCFCGQLAIS